MLNIIMNGWPQISCPLWRISPLPAFPRHHKDHELLSNISLYRVEQFWQIPIKVQHGSSILWFLSKYIRPIEYEWVIQVIHIMSFSQYYQRTQSGQQLCRWRWSLWWSRGRWWRHRRPDIEIEMVASFSENWGKPEIPGLWWPFCPHGWCGPRRRCNWEWGLWSRHQRSRSW